MTGPDTPKNVYTIPAGVPFADALARGLLAQAGEAPETLPSFTILLPTRRACRTVREAFLRLSDGRPLLLPRLQPLGDVDEEGLSILMAAQAENLNLPPAISPLKRQLLLARLIGGMGDFSRGPQQDMALARTLGQLMDQIYTEDRDLAALPTLVDRDKFADHWQITLDFLQILSLHWPAILSAEGAIDAADRRARLIRALADYWEATPPPGPVIAAGSTGSIPATARLLDVVARLPRGAVVLPGLDPMVDDPESWAALDDTHPQATLKSLLGGLRVDRTHVRLWPGAETTPAALARAALAHEIMRPADTAERWRDLAAQPARFDPALRGITRYDCATPQEEALVIATALRETLEPGPKGEKNRIAALITPDRALARRVAMACRRWGIEIDDSAGQSLCDTPVGGFLRLAVQSVMADPAPVALLAFLKSALSGPRAYAGSTPDGEGGWRGDIRHLDAFLRGPAPAGGFGGLLTKLETVPELKNMASLLKRAYTPALDLIKYNKNNSFAAWLEAHLTLAEQLCPPEILWAGDDGESAADFFAQLRDHAGLLPDMPLPDYAAILDSLMNGISVRPAFGRHPRLMILGQLEARLIQADRVILAGLNEGTWPPAPAADPWMSRPMRTDFGLPGPDRAVGLAAHDFVQGLCCPDVILTRAARVDGTPTVPARWLARLDTVLRALGHDPASTLNGGPHAGWAAHLDDVERVQAVSRPAPTPPRTVRPRTLPVTQIEKWLNDPYSIYAKYILRLKPLDTLEQPVDAAIKGTLLHEIMHKFVSNYPKDLPDDAKERFLTIAKANLATYADDSALWSFWIPRLARLGTWLCAHEADWRTDWAFAGAELKGAITLQGDFVLTARADRVDLSHDGVRGAIIDYKSGGTFTQTGIKNGTFPQLPLEALILSEGGFDGIKAVPPRTVAYWVLSGGREPGKITALADDRDVQAAMETAKAGLEALITAFDDPATPYYSLPDPSRAPRFNDYEQLARVKEWAALDETEREDAA
jgi:ATP-dependent helicase/nuclease subunit B